MTTMTRTQATAATVSAAHAAAPAAGPRAVRLVEPLPGFDGHEHFGLVPIDPEGVLIALRSLSDPTLRFVLTPADMFFDDYAPPLGAGVVAALGAAEEDLVVLLMLTISGDLADATANLRAPIVVAAAAGTAVQVVLDDETLSMHAPILPVAPPA